jgi:hypothetical protein
MKAISILLAASSLALPCRAFAAVEATAINVQEFRAIGVPGTDAKASKNSVSLWGPLKVTLSLVGPEAEAATRYGRIKLEEVIDDQGNNLIPKNDTFHDYDRLREYDNAVYRRRGPGDKRSPTPPQAEIPLDVAPRSATRIVRFRGSLTLFQQGAVQTIEVPSFTTANPKLPIPPEAGVQIAVRIPDKPGAKFVNLDVTGDETAIESIEAFDASGKKITSYITTLAVNENPDRKVLNFAQPPDTSIKLVVKIASSRTKTVVPFDLKNIPLP